MRFKTTTALLLTSSLALAPLAGCESLPGNKKQQGAVIGGVGGAAAGAAVSKDNRALGALIGGALGAGGGYLVGANMDKNKNKDENAVREDAIKASQDAQKNPAKPEDVNNSKTADLNDDGFVTLDEVAAMQEAGLPEKEQIQRLERTQQYFQLTSEQEQYLRDHNVSPSVVTAMRNMKPDEANLASHKETTQKSETNIDLRTNPR
jgi:hypothetical protein